MRVFVDTNVWIAGLISRGTCSDLLEHLIVQHTILVSEGVVGEIERVLSEKFEYSGDRIREVLDWIDDVAASVETPADPPRLTDDRDDDFVLQAALDAGAEVVVTGDADLLDVADEVDTTILLPAEFWRIG